MSDKFHTVTILDPIAQELSEFFLPADLSSISGEELKARVEALVAAARALKALRAGGSES